VISASRLPRAGRGLVLPLLGALVVLAWLALWVWGRSPEARFLSHAHAAGSPGLVVALLFIVGWIVMTVAMMLPTTFPVVAMFERMVRTRPEHRALVVLLVSGYLGVWTAFGAVAYVGDIGVHDAVDHVRWLGLHPWTIAA